MPDDVSSNVDSRSIDDIITQFLSKQFLQTPYPEKNRQPMPRDPQKEIEASEAWRKKWGDNRPRG